MKNEHAVALGRKGGKSSWAKQIQGKTKEEIHEMMAKRAKMRKKKVVKP